MILISFHGIAHLQILKATNSGFILIKDSISNERITSDYYETFKCDTAWTYWYNNWMQKNSGRYIIPTIEYDSLIVLKNKNFWGCLNLNGKEILPFNQNQPYYFFNDGLYYGAGNTNTYAVSGGSDLYDEMGSKGYSIYDWNKNIVATYTEMIDAYHGSYLMVGKSPDKCGIVSSHLDTLAPFDFECTSWDAKNFGFSSKGFIAFKNREGKCGILDCKGKMVLNFEYDYIDDVVFSTSRVKLNNKYGLIDNSDGKIKIPIRYSQLSSESGGQTFPGVSAIGRDSTGWDVYDSNYKLLGHYTFDEFGYNSRNLKMVHVIVNGKDGFYNIPDNKYVFNPIYDKIESYCLGDCNTVKIGLFKGDSILILNDNGSLSNVLIGENISTINQEFEELKLKNGKYQLLKNLQLFIPDTFEQIDRIYDPEDLDNNLMAVQKNGLLSIVTINPDLKFETPYQFESVEGNYPVGNKTYILTQLNGKYYLYDYSLQLITTNGFSNPPVESRVVKTQSESRFLVKDENGYGIYDLTENKYVIQPQYPNYTTIFENPSNWIESSQYVILLGDKVVGLNPKLEKIFELAGQGIFSTYDSSRYILVNNNKYYLMDIDGSVKSKDYEYLNSISSFILFKQKGKYGCMKSNGEIIIKPEFEKCSIADYYNYLMGYPLALLKGKKISYITQLGIIDYEGDDYGEIEWQEK